MFHRNWRDFSPYLGIRSGEEGGGTQLVEFFTLGSSKM